MNIHRCIIDIVEASISTNDICTRRCHYIDLPVIYFLPKRASMSIASLSPVAVTNYHISICIPSFSPSLISPLLSGACVWYLWSVSEAARPGRDTGYEKDAYKQRDDLDRERRDGASRTTRRKMDDHVGIWCIATKQSLFHCAMILSSQERVKVIFRGSDPFL